MSKTSYNIILRSPRWLQISLSIVVLSFCVLPAFIKAGYGAYTFDEPYQILNGLNYKSAPFAPLTGWLTGVIGNLVDWKWISFRYVAIFANTVCILLGGGVLIYVSRKLFFSVAVTASALLVGTLFPDAHNLYGWDTWTQFFLVVTMVAVLFYHRRPTVWGLVWLAVLTTLVTLVRLPNIVTTPIIFLFILLAHSHSDFKTRLKHGLLYGFLSCIFIIVGLYLLFGSMEAYISAIAANPINQHGFGAIFWSLVSDGLSVIPVICIYYTLVKILNAVKNAPRIAYIGLCVIFCLFLTMSFIGRSTKFYPHTLFYPVCLMIVGSLTVIWRGRNAFLSGKSVKMILLALLAIVPISGSNTGMLKIIVWPLIPIIGLYLLPNISQGIKWFYAIFICSMLIGSYSSLRHFSFAAEGIPESTYRIDSGKFEGIRTTPQRGKLYQEIENRFSSYAPDKYKRIVLRQGTDYAFEYLLGTRNEFLGSQFQYWDPSNSEEYIDWVENQMLSSEKPVAILYMKKALDMVYPNIPDTYDPNETTEMQRRIEKHLVPLYDTEYYTIYASNGN